MRQHLTIWLWPLLLGVWYFASGVGVALTQSDKAVAVHEQSSGAGTAATYFPRGVFSLSDPAGSDLTSELITKHLVRMGEPSLFGQSTEGDRSSCYRLTRLNPLGKQVVLRLTIEPSGTGQLFTKVEFRQELSIDKTTTVASPEIQRFLDLTEEAEFWHLPSTEQDDVTLRDGTIWVLEGKRNGHYHLAYRRSPKASQFTEMGRYLAKTLANLDDSVFYIPKRGN